MNDIEEPKVSIIIPVYNGANYLMDAISSALDQTYPNIEIIVINDGSKDNGETERIAQSYGDRIKYYYKENNGVASALNLGIEKMTGDYFSWLSHDDIYTKNKVEEQIKIIKEHNNPELLVCSGYSIIDENGIEFYKVDPFASHPEEKLNVPLFSLLRGMIHGCALLIHRNHFERTGQFNTRLTTTQDYDLWFRILRNAKIKFSKELLVLSRSHSEQGSKKYIKEHIDECNDLWISIIDSLNDKEKCEIDGSVYQFYENTYQFLKANTFYDKAIPYSKKQALLELKRQYLGSHSQEEKIKLIQIIKDKVKLANDDVLLLALNDDLESKKKLNRILFFTCDWNDRGGLNNVISLISSYISKDFEVFICAFDGPRHGYDIDPKVKFLKINYEDNFPQKLSEVLMLLEIDVYIGNINCVDEFLRIYSELNKYGIRTIAWNHEFYFIPYWNETFFSVLPYRNNIFKEVDAVVWLTSFSANVYGRIYDNSAIIPNPLSFEIPDKETTVLNNKRNIISVGRFDDPRKCLDKLIKVYADVLKSCPDTKLFVVGSYDLSMNVSDSLDETIEQLIKRLKIREDQIIFTGQVNNVEEYYKQASVFVLTAYHEGFGIVLTEAATYGLPSVVFDGSGLEDIVYNGQNGFITEIDDITEMTDRICLLLKNENRLKKMSKSAFKMTSKYAHIKIMKKWKLLINTILESRSKAELNNQLRELFVKPVNDIESFTKHLIYHYENAIKKILKTKDISNSNDS